LNLNRKTFSGIIWTFLDLLINKSIFFISTLVLARLLSPYEFGLIGMIMLFFTIGKTFVDSGLNVSLIRTLSPTNLEYSTIFYMNLILSITAYLFMYIISPYVALFYHQPILSSLIKIYCLGFIITAVRIIPSTKLTKEMNFKAITFLSFPGNLIGFFVGIWMALNGFKVWSIVGLYLSTQIVTTACFWIYSDWKPNFLFSTKIMIYHWNFSYKLMFSAQLNTFFDNIYNILIGKYFNINTLGYYERAYTYNNYPTSIFSGLISKLTLPLFSLLLNENNGNNKMRNVYRKVHMFSFYIMAPLMVGSIILADPIFTLLLGIKWKPVIPLFQIICLSNILYPIHSLNINLLSIYGKSNLFLKLEFFKKILVLILIFISIRFGVYGLVWSSVVASILALFINSYYTGGLISYYLKEQIFDILPSFLTSIIMAIFMYLVYINLDQYNLYIQILIPLFFGFIFYVTFSYFLQLEALKFTFNFIKSNLKNNDFS
jgi:O-antigen/teichoic acid export membrane protein